MSLNYIVNFEVSHYHCKSCSDHSFVAITFCQVFFFLWILLYQNGFSKAHPLFAKVGCSLLKLIITDFLYKITYKCAKEEGKKLAGFWQSDSTNIEKPYPLVKCKKKRKKKPPDIAEVSRVKGSYNRLLEILLVFERIKNSFMKVYIRPVYISLQCDFSLLFRKKRIEKTT